VHLFPNIENFSFSKNNHIQNCVIKCFFKYEDICIVIRTNRVKNCYNLMFFNEVGILKILAPFQAILGVSNWTPSNFFYVFTLMNQTTLGKMALDITKTVTESVKLQNGENN
jgi:hypothetical protein